MHTNHHHYLWSTWWHFFCLGSSNSVSHSIKYNFCLVVHGMSNSRFISLWQTRAHQRCISYDSSLLMVEAFIRRPNKYQKEKKNVSDIYNLKILWRFDWPLYLECHIDEYITADFIIHTDYVCSMYRYSYWNIFLYE